MLLLSNENLSPNETDSGDVEMIQSMLVLSGEGLRVSLANRPRPLCEPKLTPPEFTKCLLFYSQLVRSLEPLCS